VSNKLLITGDSVDDSFLTPLFASGLVASNPTHLLSEAELTNELKGVVAYLLGGDEIATAAALDAAKDLRIIAFLGVGYESFIDMNAANQRGIVVTNTPGTLTDSVAEFTVGQLINANRRLTQYGNAFRAGRRDTEQKQHDLVGRSIGIVGLGTIGSRIAEVLRKGFGARVSYHSRNRRWDLEASLGVDYLSLDALARSCDIVVVMTPGNDSTWNLINGEFLQALRQGSVLVNTAHCGVVEPDALGAALRDGPLALAVFDGFYGSDQGVRLLAEFGDDRLLVTGHIASLTHEARDNMARKAVQSICNVLATGKDEYVVGAVGRV
jgi:lactate dehydrogenase-like 2-hydroxyacid dehydrogenase